MRFPFHDHKNVAVIICKHILEDGADICYVTHDDDGCWQFMCSLEEHTEADARLISLKEAFDLDKSIGQLADMPLGCVASRFDRNSPWE